MNDFFFKRCFTLQVVQELKGALFPWVGRSQVGYLGIIPCVGNHSFVCSCVVQQNLRALFACSTP